MDSRFPVLLTDYNRQEWQVMLMPSVSPISPVVPLGPAPVSVSCVSGISEPFLALSPNLLAGLSGTFPTAGTSRFSEEPQCLPVENGI